MQSPLPENELARLQALHDYGILDTAAEAEFDDFTLLAAHICGTPVALISLVDADRQWFKSRLGFSLSETPRGQSFCAHALHQPDVFLVPDAAADDRFAGNPLVTGDPNIRFYAGAPLVTEEGQALGTLCVIDRVPRTLTPEQQAALGALSRQVIARLELRREFSERMIAEQARQGSEALKSAILQSALDCIVTINQQGCVVEWNPAAARTFGYSRESALGRDLAELIVPPALRAAHRRGMAHYLQTGEGPVLNQRIEISALHADGREFPVELAITPILTGTETLFTAYLRDISERKQAEAALTQAHEELQRERDLLETRVHQRTEELSAALQEHHNVMETVPDILFRLDLSGRLVQWNRKLESVTGLLPEALRGKPALDLFAEDEKGVIAQAIAQALRDGYVAVEGSVLGPGGAAILHQFSGVPLRNPAGAMIGLTGMGRDITERRRSEMDLLESETRYRGLVDHSPEAIVVYSENRFVYANAAAVTLFAASSTADLIGRPIFDVVHPDYHALAHKRAARSQQSGKTSPLTEQRYVRLDGKVIDVEAVSTGITYQGRPAGQVLIRDITERKKAKENIFALNSELVQAYDATIEGWSRALDLRDHETEGHSQRVTEMTLRLAQAIGVSPDTLVHIERGALLHDIGKMGVPDCILLKPGPLDEGEWEIMRRHPQDACDMLFPITFLRPALGIPFCHHEKWDGTGYPQGLRGTDIPLAARLFALVDVWDALTSDRPYRKAWPRERVLDHLRGLAGTHFDPAIVSVFLRLLEREALPQPVRRAA